ncbi:zinc-binding dehydrogenase [Mesorhizobium sp. J18]|uniref:zinc-binding dehydrogenase n=1 Tax=Mesorhizobium sp. J18 TaxID=935263 RepID=UPI0011A75FA6|nr:zinc-binding dehydrogenase [Mesorhizobium sp. J18]
MTGTMRALIQKHDGYATRHSGTVLEAMEPYVEEAQVPMPEPGPSQVLIKIRIAAVNPSDVMFVKGLYGQPRRKGQPAGFEGVGDVVSAGSEAGQALVGKRVAFTVGLTGWGSWAEYAVAEAAACIPLVEGVRDEDGAALIVNPITALAMFDIVREEGQKSFILTAGASQLCKLMIGVAKDEGFRPIAVVRRDEQIPLLERLGAAHVLNSEAPDFSQRMAALCKEEEPRILLDATTGPVASEIFHSMRHGARWIIYGRLDPAGTVIREPGQMIFMRKRIEGFWLVEWIRQVPTERKVQAFTEAQKRFSDGRWKTDVTAMVSLEEAMARVPEELAKPNGKVFIRP